MTDEQQEKARRLVQNEIYANQDTLVEKLLEKEIATYEEIANFTVDPSDWSVEQCREWLDQNNETFPTSHNPFDMDDDELRETLMERDLENVLTEFGDASIGSDARSMGYADAILQDYDDTDDDDALDAWREAVSQSRTGQEAAEVYEWWLVSNYLLEKLREAGEVVLDCDEVNESWWGRSCTGQAIYMDSVIQDIANERD